MQSPSYPKKKFLINVVTGNSGGGHIATSNAISSIIEQQLPCQTSVTDVDVLAQRLAEGKKTLDIYRLFGTSGDQVLNQIMQSGWTWIHHLTMPFNKLLIKLNYDAGVRIFEEHWREQPPDMVVSVVPLFNKMIWESLQRVKPSTPLVTILTDFADFPSAYWIEPETGSYILSGSEKGVEQARSLGVKEELIIKTSGLVINPRFYKPIVSDRAQERQRLGLDPDCLTGLVLFGGNGSKVMLEIAKRLERFQQKLQLIFICGHNEELALTLRESQGLQKRFVTTFTKDIPFYMHLCDFMIGKPGNVSISEALVMKLPVIVERSVATMPQELYTTDWIQQQQVGLVIRSFRDIDRSVEQFLQPENFARYRANVAALNNRAVFEIPDILQKILASNYKTTVAEPLQQR
ncbi:MULTISPECIES: MGDG synthase family glycosyltransferase [unclassified Nostoc]|uniref:MGDG synthase family glycosyltransferase n=1 Tax=unclassified Nostoc TaxID=2593658 RepID=UPI0026296800|nr:glycosyltransferase [Nostoc sp. S13]MDF5736295.1 glycosyltransferase [Nostoc sp. S13]